MSEKQDKKDKVIKKWSLLGDNPNRKKVREAMEKRKRKQKKDKKRKDVSDGMGIY